LAYETLGVVLDSAPPSANEALTHIVKLMIDRLDKTFSMDLLNQDDINVQNELQGHLCGVIQVLVSRLDKQAKVFADSIMTQVIKLFRSKKDAGVFEEAMLTVISIANISEGDFLRYMIDLMPHLTSGLSNWQAHQICNVSVGAVGDIARAIGPNIYQHCDKIITILLTNLQNRDLDKTVKPSILSVFGDLALAIGGNFEKYTEIVIHMLKQAAEAVIKTKVPNNNEYELIDYLNLLREGIIEAYTGIIQGMRADGKVEKIFPNLNAIMQLITHIATEKQCSESVKRGAVGIVGDLASSFTVRVGTAVTQPAVQQLIIQCLETLDYSKETKETAAWARHVTQM